MPSSVKGSRVDKSQTTKRPSSKRSRNPKESNGNEPIPLVERTNQLALEQFVLRYVPDVLLKLDEASPFSEPSSAKEILRDSPSLEIYTANSTPAEDLDACFRLVEATSAQDYANSSVGWSPSKKRREMKLPDMKYLILRHGALSSERESAREDSQTSRAEQVAGFLSFMVTYEGGKEAIYCYEIHLSPASRGRGLGKTLMLRFEEIGRRIGLEAAMLSVFRSNESARRFYSRLGYTIDESSNQPRVLRNGTVKEPDYYMLSKTLEKKESQSNTSS